MTTEGSHGRQVENIHKAIYEQQMASKTFNEQRRVPMNINI